MKELIKNIAEALVEHPVKVTFSRTEGGQSSVLELKVARADIDKVIWKRGRTAGVLRTILSSAPAKENNRTILEIMAKEDSRFELGR
jgi:predicted RNA-binding protein YlqC (UPF0109 family)